MSKNSKYKLVNKTKMKPVPNWSKKQTYYRVQALRDIPLHGVKAGDVGGYVSSKKILSQDGSCWIGGDAKVYGYVTIRDDAYIGNNANITNGWRITTIEISGNAKIVDNAALGTADLTEKQGFIIKDNAIINGNAALLNTKEISGNSKVGENTELNGCTVKDNSVIMGNAKVRKGAKVSGDSKVDCHAIIQEDAEIRNTVVTSNAEIGKAQIFSDQVLDKDGIFVTESKPTMTVMANNTIVADSSIATVANNVPVASVVPIETNVGTLASDALTESMAFKYYHELKAKIDAYTTDVVKIIKYPLMTDQRDKYTMDMTMALNKVERCLKYGKEEGLDEVVQSLEEKLLIAESNALMMAATMLTVEESKRTLQASDLLNMAANEASTENEKRIALAQGFKVLEGVLNVPESAKDAFRVKVGLKEIEA